MAESDFPARDGSEQLQRMIRAAISDAYYDARNARRSMEFAADNAAASVMKIVALVDENAHRRGEAHGFVAALQEVLLERTDEEEPFIAKLRDEAITRMEAIK